MHALEREPTLQCPACGWMAEVGDFELVVMQAGAQVHCPSCDANLGSPEHALRHAVADA